MSKTPPPPLIKCKHCNEEKEPRFFLKSYLDECKLCIKRRVAANPTPLDVKVETHRQEKEVKRLLRVELKRLARNRIEDKKKRARRKAALAMMPKEIPENERVIVDPAVKELAQRELARRRLIEFIQEFHPRYKAGWVHHDICRRLEKFTEDVAAGLSPRLMILMPPRHGKSQIASKLFPAWLLGHHNHFEVIACSYNVSLALEFSREVRDVVRSERYAALFPKTAINPEAQGAEAWRLLSPTGVGSGGYVAAGIGGPITGKGAHVLIIDDPVKNAEEADSPDQRKKIWDWYGSTAYTRLAPGGGVLVIQTCWHDDDLAGRLQEAMKDTVEDGESVADKFEVVKYPAIAIEDEPYRSAGEALHPERYDLEALMRIKNNPAVGARFWASLYQQDPVPEEGAYFTDMMFKWRKDQLDPRHMHIFQAWDFALGEKVSNDYNVGVTVGQDYEDNIHVLEVVRFRTLDLDKTATAILDMYDRYPNVLQIGCEDGKEWRGMQGYLKKRMSERRLFPTFETMKPLSDKLVRARPLQGRMQGQKVTFPRAAPWTEWVKREMLRFPSGTHEDVVDALAWVVTLVLGKAAPKRPRERKNKLDETLESKLRKLGRLGGGSAMAA